MTVKELHDKLALDFMRINKALKYYTYPSGVYDLECVIDNYEVRLVKNTNELKQLGNTMRNCVASYDRKIEHGTTLILYMDNINTHEKVACIELDIKRNEIVQIEGHHHSKLDKEVAIAFQKWCNKFNLNNYLYTGRETDMFTDYEINVEIDSYINKEIS